MFGWLKNRLLKRMQGLTEVAQMTTYFALLNVIGDNDSQTEEQRLRNSTKAAAQSNYLFGRPISEAHESQLDLRAEHATASRWASKETIFCELAVQSLRNINFIAHAQNPNRPPRIIGEAVLEKFGKLYPDAANPEAYETLLQRAIES